MIQKPTEEVQSSSKLANVYQHEVQILFMQNFETEKSHKFLKSCSYLNCFLQKVKKISIGKAISFNSCMENKQSLIFTVEKHSENLRYIILSVIQNFRKS